MNGLFSYDIYFFLMILLHIREIIDITVLLIRNDKNAYIPLLRNHSLDTLNMHIKTFF